MSRAWWNRNAHRRQSATTKIRRTDRPSWKSQCFTIEENTPPRYVCGNVTVVRPDIRRQANSGACVAPPALVGNCKIRDALRVVKSEGRPLCKFIRGANDAPQTFVTPQTKGRPLVSTFWCVHARMYVRQRRTLLRRCLRRESGGKPPHSKMAGVTLPGTVNESGPIRIPRARGGARRRKFAA